MLSVASREFRKPPRPPENHAYVLDVLPYGDPVRGIPYPLVQSIGEEKFLLMELKPESSILPSVKIGERIDLVAGVEARIFHFLRLLRYDDLTGNAKAILKEVVTNIVMSREKVFVDFFNKSQPLSKKAHQLELLKGIGKKTLWKILEERSRKPFESFMDIEKRIGIKPLDLIVNRILEELAEPQMHYIFVNPPYGPTRLGETLQRREGRERFRQSF